MSIRQRIEKYRTTGGAADFVRVEVLVPAANKGLILSHAAQLRDQHRERKQRTEAAIAQALSLYGARITENIDLNRLETTKSRARIVAQTLMERGDARAYALGQNLLKIATETSDGAQ
jgi:hypothetical protein